MNPFMPTVPTFAVRETFVSRTANVGTVGKNELNFPPIEKQWRRCKAVAQFDEGRFIAALKFVAILHA